MIWLAILFAVSWPVYRRNALLIQWRRVLAGDVKESFFKLGGREMLGVFLVTLAALAPGMAGGDWPSTVVAYAQLVGDALGISYATASDVRWVEPGVYAVTRTASLVAALVAGISMVLSAYPNPSRTPGKRTTWGYLLLALPVIALVVLWAWHHDPAGTGTAHRYWMGQFIVPVGVAIGLGTLTVHIQLLILKLRGERV